VRERVTRKILYYILKLFLLPNASTCNRNDTNVCVPKEYQRYETGTIVSIDIPIGTQSRLQTNIVFAQSDVHSVNKW
jgi:hypothetical protein